MARRFEYAQAEEIREAFARHGVRYLFIGQSGALGAGGMGACVRLPERRPGDDVSVISR